MVSLAVLNAQEILLNVLNWVNSLGSLGVMVFIGLYIITTVILVPGSLLTLGAGVIFGLFWGSIYVFLGATLGSTAAFLVGRYLARDWITQKITANPKFRAIDQAVAQAGFKIVLLTRLSPVFPFIILNYVYSLTRVSLRDFVLGSIGMIPGTVMYVYIGSLAGNLAAIASQTSNINPIALWSIRIIGFIATVTVTIYITKIAKKALDGVISESPNP